MIMYVEAQYEAARSEVRLSATTDFGEQSYRVTRPAADEAQARAEIAAFVGMYRDLGCDVRR